MFEIRIVNKQWCLDTVGIDLRGGAPEQHGVAIACDAAHLHPLDRWYAIAATYDGKTLRGYVDGEVASRNRRHPRAAPTRHHVHRHTHRQARLLHRRHLLCTLHTYRSPACRLLEGSRLGHALSQNPRRTARRTLFTPRMPFVYRYPRAGPGLRPSNVGARHSSRA